MENYRKLVSHLRLVNQLLWGKYGFKSRQKETKTISHSIGKNSL